MDGHKGLCVYIESVSSMEGRPRGVRRRQNRRSQQRSSTPNTYQGKGIRAIHTLDRPCVIFIFYLFAIS